MLAGVHRGRAPLFLIVVSALAVATGASASVAGAPLTVAQFRAQAGAICTKLNQLDAPPNATFNQKLDLVLSASQKAVDQVAALVPPASFASLHTRIVAIERKGIGYLATLVSQTKAGKLTQKQFVAKFEAFSTPQGKLEDGLWRKLGVTGCLPS